MANVPLQPQQENLPSLRVRLIAPDGHTQEADVGPFPVAMAPAAHFGPDDVIQADNVRPARDPRPIDTASRRERVLAYAAALIALAAVQLAPALAPRFGWRPAGPFGRARRALHRSFLRGDDVPPRRPALRCLHPAPDDPPCRTRA